MIARLLIAGIAVGALAAGGATAKVRHHRLHGMTGEAFTYAEPASPIPYADLDHYLHASRAERRSMETAAASPNAMSAAAPAAAETPATSEAQPAAPTAASESPAAMPPATTPASPPATETPAPPK